MKLLSGKESLGTLLDFYGEHVEVEFEGSTYSSPPLVDREEVIAEWKKVIVQEKNRMIQQNNLSKPPSLQELLKQMESSGGYTTLFPEVLKYYWFYLLEQHLLNARLVK